MHVLLLQVAELLETIKELGRKPLDALDKGALRRSLHSLTDYSKKGTFSGKGCIRDLSSRC